MIFIRSDHYSFVQKGVPAIYLTRGFQTGDPAVDGRLNFLISYLVAQDDSAPTWNPGDFFGEKFRRVAPLREGVTGSAGAPPAK